jgi:hypothetical protein
METFVSAAKVLLQGHLNVGKKVWEEFADEHHGKFFGPITPRCARSLVDREAFMNCYQSIPVDSLLEAISIWRDSARTIFGVDLSGLPPKTATLYREEMRRQLERIDEELRDPPVQRFGDCVTTVVGNVVGFLRI